MTEQIQVKKSTFKGIVGVIIIIGVVASYFFFFSSSGSVSSNLEGSGEVGIGLVAGI